MDTGFVYYSCCGKVICSGCLYAVYKVDDEEKCPFCRTPAPDSDEEVNKRDRKLVEKGYAEATYNLGIDYRDGTNGIEQDYSKALKLFQQAAELGHIEAHCCIGYAYLHGRGGVEVDKKKANHYYEQAAMEGNAMARRNLGLIEKKAGNIDRALKHLLIAARDGHSGSLKEIQELYADGLATKEDYTKALQSYQTYLGEIKSDQRDKAANFNDEYRYY